MKIGDQVVSKKTGLPAVSTIVGIIDNNFLKFIHPSTDFHTWDNLYPDWREKLIYAVKFNSPQKPFSFDELVKGSPDEPIEILELKYSYVKPVEFVIYPQDDLELFE